MRRKCLYCDKPLNTRRWFGTSIQTVRCRCGTAYARETITQSDPHHWELTRVNRSFTAHRGTDGSVILHLKYGLGLHPRREKLKRVNADAK